MIDLAINCSSEINISNQLHKIKIFIIFSLILLPHRYPQEFNQDSHLQSDKLALLPFIKIIPLLHHLCFIV